MALAPTFPAEDYFRLRTQTSPDPAKQWDPGDIKGVTIKIFRARNPQNFRASLEGKLKDKPRPRPA